MGRRPRVLAMASPAQGHIGPLMKLSQLVADLGIRVTFVNAKSIHDRVLAALPEEDGCSSENPIEIVSITDGLKQDDHKDSSKIKESISRLVPKELENLIRKINSSASEDEKIECVIADATVPWALETAENWLRDECELLMAYHILNQCVNTEKSHYSGIVNGTIHVVVGGGGCHLSKFSQVIPKWIIYRDFDFGFVKLTAFNHSSLLFEYKKSRDGNVYDSFTISRDYRDVLA